MGRLAPPLVFGLRSEKRHTCPRVGPEPWIISLLRGTVQGRDDRSTSTVTAPFAAAAR